MGFFSGIRRRIKKLIPKEIRPAIPFIAAMAPIPGIGGLASRGLADQFLKASIAKGLSDDEADIKDILRTGAIAAAPQAVGKGLGSLAPRFASQGTDSEIFKMLTGAEKALSPGGGFKQTSKIVGGQAATDFGIKQAELNQKAIEEYERDLLEKGIRSKADRRNAIFSIFVNAGYDDDEVNVMLDKYGYADGGKVKTMTPASMKGGLDKYYDMLEKLKKKKEKRVKKSRGGKIDPRAATFVATMTDKFVEQGMSLSDAKDAALKIAEEEFEDTSEQEMLDRDFGSNLQSAVSGLETAFGQPLGGRRPEPMRIIPGFASGGDVDDDDVLETEEEIITPEYLMKEEGVVIGPQVSAPDKMDSLNQLSLMLFNKPIFELTEEQFEMLKEFASDRAAMQVGYEPGKYSDDEIEMYENYKYNMNEQRPGMPIIDIDEFLRMDYGAARMGVARGGPIDVKKPDMEKDTKGKTAGPDYYIKRIEDLMDLGYDYETAGRIAYDYDEYRSAMDKGPIDPDYKEGGSVVKKKKIIAIGTGKLKDYPGIKKILEMNKKGKKRFSKAEGGLMNLGGKEMDLRGG